MQFRRILAVVCFLNFSADVNAKEEVSSAINEIQRRESASKCTDTTPLLNKLIAELEDMKGQIIGLHEMPEQMKKLQDDLKEMKGIDMEMNEKLKKQETDIQKIQPSVRRIELSAENIANRTKQISESLQSHQQIVADNCRYTSVVCDCSDIKANGYTTSGVYRIYVVDQGERYYANAYCDMTTTNGAWTVFQRRKDGSVDFYRKWNDYEYGFGNPNGEFWLGNKFLHLLTSKRRYRLRIDLEDFVGGKRYAEYSTFDISSSADKYRLRIGSYSGNAGGDSFRHQNGQRFSTKDSDNDPHSSLDCAVLHRGAWWYNGCEDSNLNGLYLRGRYSPNGSFNGQEGIHWYHWYNKWYSLKKTEMKIFSS